MKKDKQNRLDGCHVRDSGRTIEEIDKFLEEEKKRMIKVKWTPEMMYK